VHKPNRIARQRQRGFDWGKIDINPLVCPIGDRFATDYVLGMQFESSQLHHALCRKARLPAHSQSTRNWRALLKGGRLCGARFSHRGYFARVVSGPRNPVSRKWRLSLAETRFVIESY
jgi:hypothetical protein